MPECLKEVRSWIARFKAQVAEHVRYGEGDPSDDDGARPGTVYWDMSTKPHTAWTRQRSGWVKANPGPTE